MDNMEKLTAGNWNTYIPNPISLLKGIEKRHNNIYVGNQKLNGSKAKQGNYVYIFEKENNGTHKTIIEVNPFNSVPGKYRIWMPNVLFEDSDKIEKQEKTKLAVVKVFEKPIDFLNYINKKVDLHLQGYSEPINPIITEPGGEYMKNIILYGPPGTGKTYSTAIHAVAICDGPDKLPADYEGVMERYRELRDEGRIAFTTFHQSYGYEEFIEGISPKLDDDSTELRYFIKDGVFKAFCDKASRRMPIVTGSTTIEIETETRPHVFIIDEINRGNISKIFGELITLIEDTKRSGCNECVPAVLPYSQKPFSVPDNVYILGTMNTADRSIALIDTALRRRFHFVEMMPESDVLKSLKESDGTGTVVIDGVTLDVVKLLDTINNRIAVLYDREHTIGHAFFTPLIKNPTMETLSGIFEKKVLPLLQEYFYVDYSKIQLVLADNAKSSKDLKFVLDNPVKIKGVFKGNADEILNTEDELVEYTIQKDAFTKIQSYIEIYN